MSEQQQPTHTGSGPFNYSLSQVQDLIDSTPSLQPQGHVNASVYGWVPGTKGFWVLEALTDEQCARLRSFPPSDNDNDPETLNARLRDVGAVFYADYDDNEGAREMLNLTTRSGHPNGGTEGRGERETGRGHGLEGMVIDGEETRRRNDGSIHVRRTDTATGAGGS